MDKIEKIRAEIDKRYNEYSAKKKTDDFIYYSGMADALDLFEQFLDTLSEEPDKSLEEAAHHIAIEMLNDTKFMTTTMGYDLGKLQDIFIAGAKWYKEQFEKNRLFHCDAASQEDCERETDFAMEIIEKEHRQPTFLDAINYGMRLQKQQMLKDAVEGIAHPDDCEIWINLVGYGYKFNDGDKVKLIVVKED